MSQTPGSTPQTEPTESDPNADGPEGLGGGMGVSSERPGAIRGAGPAEGGVTYDSAPTHPTDDGDPDLEEGDGALDGVRPDPVAQTHPFDPDRNPRHG